MVHSKAGGDDSFDYDAAVVAMDFDALLAWAERGGSLSERRFRRGMLERAFMHADPGSLSDALRERARALRVNEGVLEGALGDELPPHAVHVPFVFESTGVGFLRLMHVVHDVSSHGGFEVELDPAARRAASEALALAATREPPDASVGHYRFTTTHPEAFRTLERTCRVNGPSLGAAAFVSACALWSRRAVRKGTVVTGRIVGSKVRDVGKLGAKLDALVRGRVDVQRLILPVGRGKAVRAALARRGLRTEVIEVGDIDALCDAALEPTPRFALDIRHRVAELRREFDAGWHGFRWHALRERVERTLAEVPANRFDLQVEVLSMLGAAQEHLGLPLEGCATLERARRIVESSEADADWIPDLVCAHLHQHHSMACARLGRHAEARKAARAAVAAARRGRQRDELFKAHGCAALVEMGAGRARQAVVHARASLDLVHAHAPGACSRTHGYLVEALGQAGDARAAKREFEQGLEHLLQKRPSGRRDSSEAWLRANYAAALWAAGRSREIPAVLEAPCVRAHIANAPLPGLLLRRYLGLALSEGRRPLEGYELLADSTAAYGPNMEPGLYLAAQINLMHEARARLVRDHWNHDVEGRVLLELSRLPAYLQAGNTLRLRRRAERALRRAGSNPQAGVAALSTLIAALGRLA